MIKIIIIQSIPEWLTIFRNIIFEHLPLLIGNVVYTDSFDHAIEIVPENDELIIITSGMFHDGYSDHRDTVTQKIPDTEKTGDKLAQMVKEINPNAKVYIYSEFAPKTNDFIDGFISKSKFGDRNIHEVLRILQKV